jgi:hypothetical protein
VKIHNSVGLVLQVATLMPRLEHIHKTKDLLAGFAFVVVTSAPPKKRGLPMSWPTSASHPPCLLILDMTLRLDGFSALEPPMI